jgi:DNA ligase (NAD+)
MLVGRLVAAGVSTTEPGVEESSGALRAAVVVLTGTLPTLTRTDAAALIESAGGKLSSSVSRKTTFVVAGADAGTKLERARELGIEVIDEAELLRRAGRST